MTLPRSRESSEELLGVDDALRRVLAGIDALAATTFNVLDALGLVAAEDVIARVNVPPFSNAAMDGYALRSFDTVEPPTRTLHVIETIAAGKAGRFRLTAGQAARIMTGAPVPDGADAVVRYEETDEHERPSSERITVAREVRSGENVRLAGENLGVGSIAVASGTLLGPTEIGVLASIGRSAVQAHPRPVVGILSTGDEVIAPGNTLCSGQIYDSNAYVIHTLVRQAGGEPRMLGIARDASTDLIAHLERGPRPDLYVTSGGVSVGDYDLVKDVLRTHGTIDIWQVRMKPGRPLAFGRIGATPLLGLPGNPVAALVSFLQFGRPLIRKLLGRSDLTLPSVGATLTESIDNPGGRRHFVRGVVTFEGAEPIVRPVAARGAGILSAAAEANCLIVVPEQDQRLDAGSTVSVQLFDPA